MERQAIEPGNVSGASITASQGFYTLVKGKDDKIIQLENDAIEKDIQIAQLQTKIDQLEIYQSQSGLASRVFDLEPLVANILKQLETKPNTIKASSDMAY